METGRDAGQQNSSLKGTFRGEHRELIRPPKTWTDLSTHWRTAIRHPWYRSTETIRSEIAYAAGEFFRQRDFVQVNPIITASSVSSPTSIGSDSTPVDVIIQGQKVYLLDSAQFMLEMAYRSIRKGIWYNSVSVRSDRSDESHLNEFNHLEVETGWNTLGKMLDFAEEMLSEMSKKVLATSSPVIESIAGTTSHIDEFLGGKIPRIPFEEVRDLLKGDSSLFSSPTVRPDLFGLSHKGELALLNRLNTQAVWITHDMRDRIPFYQQPSKDREHCENADLLLRWGDSGGESLGSGLDHTSSESLRESIRRQKISEKNLEYYIEMHDDGLDTGGYGLGVDRFMLWLLQHNDIRDLQPYIRIYGQPTIP